MDEQDLLTLMNRPGTVLTTLPGEQEPGSFGLFSDPETVLAGRTPDEVKSVFAEAEEALNRGRYLAGFVAYEAAPAFDAACAVRPDGAFVPAAFGVYRQAPERITLPRRSDTALAALLRPELDRCEYDRQFAAIKEHIIAGDIYQTNLTFRVRAEAAADWSRLFLNLVTRHPAPYAAYLYLLPEFRALSCSPELFLESCDGCEIHSSPMKGTAKRAPLPGADRRAAAELAADPKNLAENLMITDMVRNDLGRICRPGSIRVDPLFRVDTYPTLHQMISTVHGELDGPKTLFELFAATFPPASITGAPKIRAMELIAAAELSPRRLYTGAIGCVLPDRKLRFNVAIRTLVACAEHLESGAGGGITFDSQAEAEWQEALLKTRYATVNHSDFEVFETMRWTPDEGFASLAAHLRRAEASQRYFCRPFGPGAVETALAELTPGLAADPEYRDGACVKFTLAFDGSVRVEATPPRQPDWRTTRLRVLVSNCHTDPDDIFLYHKTTHREFYNRHFQAAREAGFHEVIFCNRHGQLTEGAISNLIIGRSGRRLTPRLQCGLLPGIRRAELLAAWRAEETCLTVADLAGADEIWLCNSLRGEGRVDEAVLANGTVIFSR
ncbi:MAG: chorismate-binding protein [Victivallaceae bacterium]